MYSVNRNVVAEFATVVYIWQPEQSEKGKAMLLVGKTAT